MRDITCSYDKINTYENLNLSKAADIQPETLLKNKLFHQRYFARFLSGTLFSGSFHTKQPNQPSVIMQPGKLLKPVSLAQPFSVSYHISSLEIES